MNIQALDNIFNAAEDLDAEMRFNYFCDDINDVSDCSNCVFHKGLKDGCILNNALSILDEARNIYNKKIKNIG
jgi:GTP-sensing pleiotropic transcriptional regulator CodY